MSYFYKLRAFTHYQRENKFKYRNFFLVKCVLEIMKRGVARDLYNTDTETYKELIQRLIDIRRLKYLDQNEVNKTVFLFEMQVKAAIFH